MNSMNEKKQNNGEAFIKKGFGYMTSPFTSNWEIFCSISAIDMRPSGLYQREIQLMEFSKDRIAKEGLT